MHDCGSTTQKLTVEQVQMLSDVFFDISALVGDMVSMTLVIERRNHPSVAIRLLESTVPTRDTAADVPANG